MMDDVFGNIPYDELQPQSKVKFNMSTSKSIVKISPETRAQLDALPDVSPTKVKFTPEQDEIIKEYYVKKNKADLCKIIGCSEKTLRKRYRELTHGTPPWKP